MEGFKHRHITTGLGHVGGAGHAGRAGANDADLEAVRLDVRDIGPARLDGRITDKALKPPDGHRLQRFTNGTHPFTLVFLWANAATDGRQQTGLGQDVVGAAQVFFVDLLDESGNVDAHRAARHAGLVRAHQAAFRLAHGVVRVVAAGHLFKIFGAHGRVLLAHRGALLRNAADGLFLRHDCLPLNVKRA